MPRAIFSGVRLIAVNVAGMDTTVSFPDVSTFETFLKMKDACDDVVSPKIALDGKAPEGKDGK